MSDYTPTTEQIRAGYIGEPEHFMDKAVGEEFDRWLAAHDAEVQERADRWKAAADSADALLRAVMDALSIRPDQDPVIEARRISVALAEQGTENPAPTLVDMRDPSAVLSIPEVMQRWLVGPGRSARVHSWRRDPNTQPPGGSEVGRGAP
ncbi:hypothetical protein G3H63_09240 [Microbacterium resistens]|uniref:hypothetical protein n=1 Tax=Microbacterium resistens TaxID=156977 RepID=UPI001C5A4C01|nr:hypothetical protein [Microbacterium resistens]MBW1639254.1 hypothetical protein [Microbacterium resistens]